MSPYFAPESDWSHTQMVQVYHRALLWSSAHTASTYRACQVCPTHTGDNHDVII